MKIKAENSRKLRYGGVTAVLTALIIAAVIVFNVIFTALGRKFLWYADLTPELFFTLSENCVDLIENGDPTFEESTSPIQMVDKMRAEKRAHAPPTSAVTAVPSDPKRVARMPRAASEASSWRLATVWSRRPPRAA